jgi:hypothetical protein
MCGANSRAVVSMPPPGFVGTSIVIGFSGYSARAGLINAKAIAPARMAVCKKVGFIGK